MEETSQIEGKESELNFLLKEGLDGLRDDIAEAAENVEFYYKALQNEPGGKELYGSLYNDSLKIKGSTRDRFLKLVALLKDRVSKKEDMASRKREEEGDKGITFNHSDLNKLMGELNEKNQTVTYIPPKEIITEDNDDDENNYDDDDTEWNGNSDED